MDSCIFCQIAEHKKEADIVFENNDVVVFNDINPKSDTHLLIVPKKHIDSIKEIGADDENLLGKLIVVAKNIAEERKLSGYKLLFNVGRDGGQVIDHIHLHLLG